MILYYTGTGNSRFAARRLAALLEDELHDLNQDLKTGYSRIFRSERPWVFVSPTYAWQLPRLLQEYLPQCQWNGSQDAWFLLTCGDGVGSAAQSAQALCRKLGLRFRGLLPVVMPENYLAMFPVPGPEEAQQIVQDALPQIDRAAELIRGNEDFPDQRPRVLDRLLSGPINTLFYSFCVTAKPFRVSDACLHCRQCQALCPTNTIRMEDGKPVWEEGCTHCMACIAACPAGAIEYGKASVGKPRHYLE
ncbi:MAG: EFR1 family ferrodoxin [Candidatus Onthomonas sp.]